MHQWERSVEEKLKYCDSHRRAHTRARFIWGRAGSVLGATLTVSAALSGGTVIANIEAAAIVLGILTAVLGGVLSALAPSDRAAEHLVSASDFSRAFATAERLYVRAATRRIDFAQFDAELVAIDRDIERAETRASRVKVSDEEQGEATIRVDSRMESPDPDLPDQQDGESSVPPTVPVD